MSDKETKPTISFEQALLKIANTPKSAIVNKHKEVDKSKLPNYTDGEVAKKPPQP